MALVVGNNQVKLNDGSTITAKSGEWYDARQWVNGSLSQPGQIHPEFGGVGAGQQVSSEVNQQSDAAQGNNAGAIDKFIQEQLALQQQQGGNAQVSTPSTTGTGTGAGIAGSGFASPEVPDLASQFKDLMAGSGINEKQAEFSQMEKDFIEAKGKINDNPFLSEASRVGREAKITKLFDERTANIRGDIATAKADAETQLNLQLKQFDLNSQAAKTAMDQFNFLLTSGALDNASGEDIAAITRSTGVSSNLIQSAIQASKKKNVETQVVQSEDASGNVTISVINKNTGEVISQNSLGQVGSGRAPSAGDKPAVIGSSQYVAENKSNVSNFLFSKQNSYGHVSPGEWDQAMKAWITDSLGSREDFIQNFKNLTDPVRADFETETGYGFPKYLREE